MVNKSKYLHPETKPMRVPVAIADEVAKYAADLDRSRWLEGCVFTLGPMWKHQQATKKLTQVKK